MQSELEITPAACCLYVSLGGVFSNSVVGSWHARMCFRNRQNLRVPIISHRAGVKKPAYPVLQAQLQRIKGPLDIRTEIGNRIGE